MERSQGKCLLFLLIIVIASSPAFQKSKPFQLYIFATITVSKHTLQPTCLAKHSRKPLPRPEKLKVYFIYARV